MLICQSIASSFNTTNDVLLRSTIRRRDVIGYFLEFPAHFTFFPNKGVKGTELFILLKRKPSLIAVQANTFGSIVTHKTKDRTEWATNTGG